MKTILTLISLLCLGTVFGQEASRLASTQATVGTVSPPNIMYVDKTPGAQNRIWLTHADSLKIKPIQLRWMRDSVVQMTATRYRSSAWVPSISDIPTLSASLASKMNIGAQINYTQVDGFTFANLQGVPTTFAPSAHTHTSAQIADFDTRLSDYQPLIAAATISNWNTAYSWGPHAGLYRPITYTPTKADVGLPNADNTSDANKPISIAVNTALSSKFNNPTGTTSQYLNGQGTPVAFPSFVPSVFGRTGAITAANGDYNTSQVTESGNLYFTNARVIATALTAISFSDASAVVATDNILSAIGKLQAQITYLGFAVNSTAIGLSRATLNSTYPTAAPRFMVFCPDITLGGAIYVKVTTGSSGRWQTISAPPTL